MTKPQRDCRTGADVGRRKPEGRHTQCVASFTCETAQPATKTNSGTDRTVGLGLANEDKEGVRWPQATSITEPPFPVPKEHNH